MNRMDRLLAIVLELQARGPLTADTLARTFELSKRTIYRDIQALCEAGVPLVASTRRGYSIMEGYFLPPLMFTAEEAGAVAVGAALPGGTEVGLQVEDVDGLHAAWQGGGAPCFLRLGTGSVSQRFSENLALRPMCILPRTCPDSGLSDFRISGLNLQ